MRGRTRLTTPPGEEPASELAHDPDHELYSPGFDRPSEPRVPGRHRTKIVVLVVLVTLAALGYVAFTVATEGQFQDPALSDLLPGQGDTEPAEQPTATPQPTETGSASAGQG